MKLTALCRFVDLPITRMDNRFECKPWSCSENGTEDTGNTSQLANLNEYPSPTPGLRSLTI